MHPAALASLTAMLLVLPACPSHPGRVAATGSSSVYPITEAIAEVLSALHPGVQVTVDIAGTGGGFQKLCAGETDLAGASRPIKQSELAQCRRSNVPFVELPIAYDAIAVVANPKNGWASDLSVAELKRLWQPAAQGRVTRWSQVRTGWPDVPIHLFGPGAASGTYDAFTEAILGAERSSRTDYAATADPNLTATGVAAEVGALGFFSLAYHRENEDKLKLIGIDAGAGPVLPTTEAVQSGAYRPLSRLLFLYASARSLERPEVATFLDVALQRAPALVARLGYLPLPQRAYDLAKERAHRRWAGSLFAGQGLHDSARAAGLLEAATADEEPR